MAPTGTSMMSKATLAALLLAAMLAAALVMGPQGVAASPMLREAEAEEEEATASPLDLDEEDEAEAEAEAVAHAMLAEATDGNGAAGNGNGAAPSNPQESDGKFRVVGAPAKPAGGKAGGIPAWRRGLKERLVMRRGKLATKPINDTALPPEQVQAHLNASAERAKARGGADSMSFHRIDRRTRNVYETAFTPERAKLQLAALTGGASQGQSRGSLLGPVPQGDEEEDDKEGKQEEGEEAGAGGRGRRYVFTPDGDNRVRYWCGNENYYPTSAIVQITTADGSPMCSGTLVGPRHVLTAAHCLRGMGPSGTWYDVRVVPRRNCYSSHAPLGTYSWSTMYVNTEWTRYNNNWDYDYGMIVLSASPNAGWMSFGYNTAMTTSWGLSVRGYMMEDRPAHEIYSSYRSTLKSVGTNIIAHYNDIVRGTSGSAMFAYWSPSTYILYGVQSYHMCPASAVVGAQCTTYGGWWIFNPAENGAVRIRSSNFAQICGWINDRSVC